MQPPPSSSGSLAASSDGSLPLRIGGYRVLRRLATGGTSDVLLARAEGPHGFERVVVLKLLLQQFRDDEKFERMFAREAAAYARLSHPAIVKLYDFFADVGQLVMVLEYVDGLPLHKLRALLKPRGRTLGDGAAMFVAWRIFSALSAAHSAKAPETGDPAPVIHRDVNPSNVLIPWDGHAKIADFGIAKVAGVDGETAAGLIKGTYGYMAPEQVRGEPLTIRADVYAACLLFWELLSGRKAIVRSGRGSDLEVLRAMAEPSFPSLASLRPDLPKPLLDAVARGLEPDPHRRDIDADALCNAVRVSTDLDDGRRALIEVLASVRPPSDDDDAKTASWPRLSAGGAPDDTLTDAPRLPPPSPADAQLLPPVHAPPVVPALQAPQPPNVPAPRPRAPLARGVTMKGVPPLVSPAPPPAPALSPRTAPAALPPRAPTPLPPQASPPVTASRPSSPPARAVPHTLPHFAVPGPAPTPPPAPMPSAVPPFSVPPAQPPAPVAETMPFAATLPAHAAWNPLAVPAAVAHPVPLALPEIELPKRHGVPFWVVLVATTALVATSGIAAVLWARAHASVASQPPASHVGATTTSSASPTPSAPPSAASRTPTPPPTTTTSIPTQTALPTVSPPATATAAAAAPSESPSATSTSGQVSVPAKGGHRVWIDGHVVGESPGSYRTACGRHKVRVGSHGREQSVDVPCGGEVEVR